MMKEAKPTPSLDRPARYQIKVPGHLGESWTDWDERMAVVVEYEAAARPITTLTGTFDHAALQGVLRRLYSLGLPFVSVLWIEGGGGAGWASLRDYSTHLKEDKL